MNSTVTLPPTNNYKQQRMWNLKTIWDQSNTLKTKQISVDSLWNQRYAKAWCWQHNQEIINNDFFLHHLQRIMNADLSYPIILSEENYILDGVHRLMKCKYLNLEYISYKQFNKDPLPDIQ